jgi:hypothetical protein
MSIRIVQTSFTSSTSFPPSSDFSAWGCPPQYSQLPTDRVLSDLDMNYPRPSQLSQASRKLPPGLGYYSMPTAIESSPSLVLPNQPPPRPRRRSGSFSYGSIGDRSQIPNPPALEVPAVSGPGSSLGSWGPSQPKRRSFPRLSSVPSSQHKLTYPVPPLALHQAQKSASESKRYSAPNGPIKFDPFGSDDALVVTPPLSNTYNHYWQYNPSTNSPVMMYNTDKDAKISSTSALSTHLSDSSIAYNKLFASAPTVSLPLPSPSPLPVQISLPLPKPVKVDHSKKVANILLNRIYAVGKPRRKGVPTGTEKEYVKSNLSNVTTVEC